MVQLDDSTANHLQRWLDTVVPDSERDKVLGLIFGALDSEPDLLDRGFSWPEIERRGSGEWSERLEKEIAKARRFKGNAKKGKRRI